MKINLIKIHVSGRTRDLGVLSVSLNFPACVYLDNDRTFVNVDGSIWRYSYIQYALVPGVPRRFDIVPRLTNAKLSRVTPCPLSYYTRSIDKYSSYTVVPIRCNTSHAEIKRYVCAEYETVAMSLRESHASKGGKSLGWSWRRTTRKSIKI